MKGMYKKPTLLFLIQMSLLEYASNFTVMIFIVWVALIKLIYQQSHISTHRLHALTSGIGGNLQVGVLTDQDLSMKYETSGNISYSSSIVNPNTTVNHTSRLLLNRYINTNL